MSTLIAAERLRRVVQFDSGDVIEYQGNGVGWEGVFVNGEPVSIKKSVRWYVPHFDFEISGQSASVDVSVGPTLKIKSFRLLVDGGVVHADSHANPPVVLSSSTSPPPLQLPKGHATRTVGFIAITVLGTLLAILLVSFFLSLVNPYTPS